MIFVDDMYQHPMGKFGQMRMSHLIGDNATELHALAAKIGIARAHFHVDHYDICMKKRELAIKFGAQPVTMRQASAMVMMARAGRRMGTPETAIDRWHAWKDTHVMPSRRRKRA